MPVPSLNTVTPSTGHTGGRNLVTVTGTNFRLPPTPPATGPSGPLITTVEVLFGNERATDVKVYSATEITCLPPPNDPGVVSVTVTNLDNNGVAIPGETITKVNAYTYARPKLTTESDLTRVVRGLTLELKRQIIENVVVHTHADYDDFTADGLRITSIAKLPVLMLDNFEIRQNRLYAQLAPVESAGKVLRPGDVVDLTLSLRGASDHTIELLNMQDLVLRFFNKNKSIQISTDYANPNADRIEYEMDFFRPDFVVGRLNPRLRGTNVGTLLGSITIHAIEFGGFPGFTDDAVEDRVYTVEEILVQLQKFS